MKKKIRKMVALILAAAMVIPSASLTLAAGAKPVAEAPAQEAEPESAETAQKQGGRTAKPEESLQESEADQIFKEQAGTPAGTEETPPEDTGTAGQPKETAENLLTLTGAVTAEKPGDPPSALAGILVRFYDAAAYDKHAETHSYDAEAVTKEDGTYQAEGLAPGEYRVEFVSRNETLQPERYTLEPLPDDAGYEVRMWAEEPEEERPFLQKEDVYVACIPRVGIWEPGELNLTLVEQEVDEQPEPGQETEDSEAAVPGESEHTDEEVTTGTEDNTEQTHPETEDNTDKAEPGSEGGAEAETTPEATATPEVSVSPEPAVTGEEEKKDTHTAEPEVPENTETEESDENFNGLMSIKDLEALDEEIAGATMEKESVGLLQRLWRSVTGDTWSFDTYYVNQQDRNHVEKTGDFNLKYQMEFHASQDIEINGVQIRIPKDLFKYRGGTPVAPSDIAVPMGTPGNTHASRTTPFNYYKEDSGDLVFFNYRKITSGTNAAFQVLYKNLRIMEIRDETKWTLEPEITVTPSGGTAETKASAPLTGRVDSEVNLSSVTKKPYNDTGNSYTPGLYTKSQVKSYISGELPQKYETNFSNYRYVVWDVTVRGSGTQPWNLLIKNKSTPSGEVVGYRSVSGLGLDLPLKPDTGGYMVAKQYGKNASWDCRFRVVTAYPKSSVQVGTILQNEIDVKLVPYDKIDPVQQKSGTAQWNYVDYTWNYRGDTIGVSKSPSNKTYKGWLETYKRAIAAEEDRGEFPFRTVSECRAYKRTHETEGSNIGQAIPGREYEVTTVDDVLYAYPGSNTTAARMLTGEDYYFSGITVEQRDTGYDVWEDTTASPESSGDLVIYAKFADSTQDWERVETVPWNDSGRMSYKFSREEIAREPWRVKAVHRGVNYQTNCDIAVNVTLKHDSPVIKDFMAEYPNMQELTIENRSGVMGEQFTNGISDGYFHQKSATEGNYEHPELKEFTQALYGVDLERDSAFAKATSLGTHAASYKTEKTSNDANNSRALVDYCLTAYDGYEIYGQEGVDYLRGHDLSPGRNQVVFYDLLPYGMKFDPSVPVTAGRITNTTNNIYKTQPKSWDATQIQVTVDSEKDIIENYKGTGRTMVVFHIKYTGADPAVYNEGKWMEGFGVSFRAYYDWKDMDVSQKAANISAFMPEAGDNRPLLGTNAEVAKDDGVIVPSGFEEDYKDFGADINGDGVTDIRNVLYARNVAREDMALASETKIEKLVRADEDRFGSYQTTAVTSPGEGYTYDVTVSNASDALTDLVVFDRLEYALHDHNEEDTMVFENDCWEGTFSSVIIKGLEELGIAPVIYYNGTRAAEVSDAEGTQPPSAVLTEANGWYTASQWEAKGNTPEEVKAVAVDLSKNTDGTSFVLDNNKSVTFQIKMTAPLEMPRERYAYNNASFYSHIKDQGFRAMVRSSSTRVDLEPKESLEVVKAFRGDIPQSVRNTVFEFALSEGEDGKTYPFANREYQLWSLNAQGAWIPDAERLYATDADGRLTLRAGEKAVFPALADADRVQVKEEENPFWNPEVTDTGVNAGGVRVVTVNNAYRPVLYVQKKFQAAPEDFDSGSAVFTFQAKADNALLTNAEFWYVDGMRTDGGIPAKVTSLGENGIGQTDAQGRFSIKEGEIIALFPGKAGTGYEIKEVEGAGAGTDWICQKDTVTGTLPVQGASASITNIYQWKDLYLTKNITHQNPADCDQSFTFRITEVVDDKEIPVTGNRWVLLENGEETNTQGTLDKNGEFTCACAGKIVKIKKLKANHTYIVQETESGELYQPVDGGMAEVTMPIYSSKEDASITNDYLKRPLSVSKVVSFDQKNTELAAEVAEKDFTMTVTLNNRSLGNYPYTVTAGGSLVRKGTTDAQGNFTLRHGQTALFAEIGVKDKDTFEVTETQDEKFPQIYPMNDGSHTGIITGEGTRVTFVNGASGGLMLSKEYTGADAAGIAYAEATKTDAAMRASAAVDLTLTATAGEESYVWPKKNQTVTVIDQLDGTFKQETWLAGSAFPVEPWNIVSIGENQLTGVTAYALSEAGKDQHRVLEWPKGTWLTVSQKEPENDRPVTGTVSSQPVAVIYNQVEEIKFNGSEIEKRMALGSDPVPEGAELVWRAQRYDGTAWSPAEGLTYLIFDGKGAVSDRVLETGADGRILLTKTANGYPSARFTKDRVYLNRNADAREGDLRLVEVLEESDGAWGILAGYGAKDNVFDFSLDVPSEEAVAFVNSSRTTSVEIEKKMEAESDAVFTMFLKQVLSSSAETITKPEDILESQARAGIPYTVHDTATGKETGTGTTGKNGEIRLRAGQYARLELPDKTRWTVSEELNPTYALKELSGQPPEKVTKLSENLMLLCQKAPEITPKEIAVSDNMELLNPVTGELIELKTGKVVIPEYVVYEGEMRVVTGIAIYGFNENLEITEIQLPDTLKTIGQYAFDECSGLTGALTIPEGVTSIGMYAFANCSGLTGALTIPEGVTSIEQAAFQNCSGLTGDLTIPEGVTSIELGVFSGCNGFDGTLTIPEGVTSIGKRAFNGCSGLKGNLSIPESVEIIEGDAFRDCSSFDGTLRIPDSVTSIGNSAFEDCSGFTGNLTIPEDVTSIENYAFRDCSGLTGTLTIPEGLASIANGVFDGCSGLTETLTIPESVTSIGDYAFRGCSGFTGNLMIPEGVTSIGSSAFNNCSSFTGDLTIPRGVTSIENGVFNGCSGLTGDLTIPKSVASIGGYAFRGCSGLDGTLTIPEGVTSIGIGAFESCSGLTGSLTIPGGVTRIRESAFDGCSGFTGTLTIPRSVTSIERSAFESCSGFTGNLTLPESVTSIGVNAFSDCSGFTGTLTIPEGVTSIAFGVFSKCSGFTGTLTIPEGVTSIESYAFWDCSGFTGDLTIPEGVTSIGNWAFNDCSGFTGDLTIPEGVTSIGNSAFHSCNGFTGDLTIPASVDTIDLYAFSSTSFPSITVNKPKNSISGSPWGWKNGTVVWNG